MQPDQKQEENQIQANATPATLGQEPSQPPQLPSPEMAIPVPTPPLPIASSSPPLFPEAVQSTVAAPPVVFTEPDTPVRPTHGSHKRAILVYGAVAVVLIALVVFLLLHKSKPLPTASTVPSAGRNNSDSSSSSLNPYTGIQQKAKDTKRKTDINALEAHLAAYWATNGFYPTLGQMNDTTWLSKNFSGIDTTELQDPEGTLQQLVSTPAPKHYAYQYGLDKTLASCDKDTSQCQYFKLTATLSDGTLFSKDSNY